MAGKIKNKDIHKEALDRFSMIMDSERDQRELAVEDLLFVHAEDGQWEEEAIQRRKDKPRYTINRVAGAIDQITGDQRQTRKEIKVIPQNGGTKNIAKIKTGLIRNIQNNSDAAESYDNGFDEMTTCGYGGWRVLTEFPDDSPFDQEIIIAPIKSAVTSLFFDLSAQKYDKRDANYAFLVEDIILSSFKETYPNASITDFNDTRFHTGQCAAWFKGETIQIAEYWIARKVKSTIGLMSNGMIIDLIEEKEVLDELKTSGITIIKTKEIEKRKVESFIMNGAEILEGPMEWAGKYIPLIPLYGRSITIKNKEYIRGVARFSKDAQRIYNYTTSSGVETTALTPKDPIWMTHVQAKGEKERLKRFNTQNNPFMFYTHDPEEPGAPKRTGAPALQQSLIQQQAQSSIDIYSTTGIQPPSLGINPELQSGKAVVATQKMGDRGTFVYTDNLKKSINYTGDIIDDLMAKIYDRQRVIQILNIDGTTEDIEINVQALDEFNQPVLDKQTNKVVIVNDLSQGKYKTMVDVGPAFTTMREESAQQLIQLATGSERFERHTADLIAKNLNILESTELTSRIRASMIKEGLIKPTEEEIGELGLDKKNQPSPEQKALLDNLNMQTAKLMADIQNKNADTDAKDAKTLQTKLQAQKEAVESLEILMKAYTAQAELGIPLGVNEHHIRKAQQAILNLSQEELVLGSVQATANGVVR